MSPTTLRRADAVLLLVDVQERINAVMSDQGHVPRLEVLVDACRELAVPVVSSEQYPKGLGPTLPSLAERLERPPLEKATFSCGGDDAIVGALEATGRSSVVVTGIEAHVCVVQTVLDLLERGLAVHVPHDAVNSRRPADRTRALDRMAAAGATVTTTESVLFELLERCDAAAFRTVSKMVKRIPV